jgi:hypothetical protein
LRSLKIQSSYVRFSHLTRTITKIKDGSEPILNSPSKTKLECFSQIFFFSKTKLECTFQFPVSTFQGPTCEEFRKQQVYFIKQAITFYIFPKRAFSFITKATRCNSEKKRRGERYDRSQSWRPTIPTSSWLKPTSC